MSLFRIAGTVQESYTDGEGIRYVIFFQGCDHKCKGCQNPETWDFNGGKVIDTVEILKDIDDNPYIDGITLSGGDPLYQPDTCLEIIKQFKDKHPDMDVWVYTGFTYEHCLNNSKLRNLLNYIDILVDGAFDLSQRDLSKRFRGSLNQRIIDVQKSLVNNSVEIYISD